MLDLMQKFNFPSTLQVKRNPARPLEFQVFDFNKKFDYDTLWNDIVKINPTTVLLIGPPLYDFADYLDKHCYFVTEYDQVLDWKHIVLDRVSVIVITVPESSQNIFLSKESHRWNLSISNQCQDFDNKVTAVTISKDNEITWIKQWIEYHKTVHNLEGLLIYNNQSTLYTSQELLMAIERPDIVIKVVDYDVPYGPQGCGKWEFNGKAGEYLPWDSDFAQYVMMEHAKWKYLTRAKLAISIDFDELLLTGPRTLDQLSEYCQTSDNSVLCYSGTWIEPISTKGHIDAKNIALESRKFSEYYSTTYSTHAGVPVKYMLNPQRNLKYQWLVHHIHGPYAKTNDISYGHFMALNTGWSWSRDTYKYDIKMLQPVHELRQNMEKIWGPL